MSEFSQSRSGSTCRRTIRWRLLAWSLLLAGCGAGSPQVPESAAKKPEAPVIQDEVLTVQSCIWPTIVRTQGTLFADEVAVVGAKVAGRVAEVNVDLGDSIPAGEELAALDMEEFGLAVDQAKAQLLQARAAVGLKPGDPVEQLQPENAPPVREEKALWDEARAKSERWQQLRKQNAVTEADLEAVIATEEVAAARYASALNSVNEKIALIRVRDAELLLAEQRQHDAVIRAPFDGLVQERHVAPGTFVQVGQPIATIVRTNLLHFRGMLPERHARKLAKEQYVTLQIESIDKPRTARVTRISPTLDELSRSLLFEVELDNGDGRLQTGLFAEAAVELDSEATAIVVPASAITEFAGAEKAWKVVDGQASEQIVTTGKRRDDLIEVVNGLAEGDVILWHADKGRMAPVDAVARTFNPPRLQHVAEGTESEPGTELRAAESADQTDPTVETESTGGP